MTNEAAWTQQGYNASVTSQAWRFTIYEDGWEGGTRSGVDIESCDEGRVENCDEIKAIFLEEMSLGSVPAWAV